MSAKKFVHKVTDRIGEFAQAARQTAIERGAGHTDYSRFVIVSNIRSGSTMLTDMLKQHENARCFYELFHVHPGSIPFLTEGYAKRSRDPEVLRLRDKDPVEFLGRSVWSRMPEEVRTVGFKLMVTQARSGPMWWDDAEFADWWEGMDNVQRNRWFDAQSDVWQMLYDDRHIKIILLERKNLLRSAVSTALAIETAQWGDGATGGFRQDQGVTISLSTDTLIRDFRATQRQFDDEAQRFADHPLIRISYEELVADQSGMAARIQDFLGISQKPVEARTRKMMQKPYSEVVRNWDEVCNLLQGTEWERFLEG